MLLGCAPKGYVIVKSDHLITLRDGIVWYVDHSIPYDDKTKIVGEMIKELSQNLIGEKQ